MKIVRTIFFSIQVSLGILFLLVVCGTGYLFIQSQQAPRNHQAVLAAETAANTLKSLGFQVPVTFGSDLTANGSLYLNGDVHVHADGFYIGGRKYTFPDMSTYLTTDAVTKLITDQIAGIHPETITRITNTTNTTEDTTGITINTVGGFQGGGTVHTGQSLTFSCPTCLTVGDALFTASASSGSAFVVNQGKRITFAGGSNLTSTSDGLGMITLGTLPNPVFTSVNGLTLGPIIQPTTDTGLTILANGNNNIVLGQNSGTGNIIIQPNAGGQAALIVNKQGLGDIFTASASGSTKFVISQNGYVSIGTNNVTSPLTIVAPTSGIVPTMNFMTPTNLWTDTQYISFTNARALFGYDGANASAFVQSASDKGLELQTNGANTRVFITSTGSVGIGTMNPGTTQLLINQQINGDVFAASFSGTPLFRIDRNGNTRIAASLCVKGNMNTNCSGSNAGSIYATNTSITSADYAENYISSQHLVPGDVVMLAHDGNSQAIVKSTDAYQQQVIGIVSTNPGITLNSDATTDAAHPYTYPIALSGRVPVRVSTENGPIHSGDSLTTSSQTGVAMKATTAGTTIGKALEDYTANSVGNIMVFVSVGYTDPQSNHKAIASVPDVQEVSSTTLKDLTLTGALTASGSAEFKGKTIFDNIAEFIAKVIFHTDVDLLGKTYIAHPVFGTNTAGSVTIPIASDEAHVTFSTPFETKPIINVTLAVSTSDASNSAEQSILNGDLRYVLENEDVSGFTIKINKPIPDNVSVNWTALNNQ